MQKLNSPPIIRAVTALWVMLFHMSTYVTQYGITSWDISWLSWGSLRMPTFFMLSGFLNVYVLLHRNYSIRVFLLKKAIRIYPVYYLFLPAALLGCTFIASPLMCDDPDYLASIFLITPEVGRAYILPWTWFLEYEILFYLILAAGLTLFKERFYAILILLAFLICFYQGFLHAGVEIVEIGNRLLIALLSPYFLYVTYGAFFALYFVRKCFFYLALAFFVLVVLAIIGKITIISLGAIMAISFLLAFFENEQRKFSNFCKNRKFLRYMAQISYSLYLSHLLVLSAVKMIWIKIRIESDLWQVAWIITMVIACIVFAAVFHELIEKPLTSFLNKKIKVEK